MKRLLAALLAAATTATAATPASAVVDIPVTVHESARSGPLRDEPVTLVFPLPDKAHRDVSRFTLLDEGGRPVPAQFAPLTRWRGRGEYVQHVLANALVSLPSGGARAFRLAEGAPLAPASPAAVSEAGGLITVTTGPLRFTVRKSGFNLFEQVWIEGKEVLESGPGNGGVLVKRDGSRQASSGNAKVTVTVEESGPVRVVLHAFGLSAYAGRDDFRHGFRCRIYAYAGQPFVRVDFALRNTPHGDSRKPAGPMYFKDFSLEHALKAGASAKVRVGLASGPADSAAVSAADAKRKTPGWIDVSDGGLGVMASVRHFWQQHPLENRWLAAGRRLKLGLWPAGFPDYYYPRGNEGGRTEAPGFWLDDGIQKTHQVCYLFHDRPVPDAELARRHALCETPPVGRVAPAHWDAARSLPDGGYIDPAASGTYAVRTDAVYGKWDFNGQTDRRSTGGAGGLPRSLLHFIATGDPRAHFDWEPFCLMETDVRPTHMDNLMQRASDTAMDLFTNQYRKTHYKVPRPWEKDPAAAYESGTGTRYHAWDAEHMWIYPFYELYLVNGDPRMRDFYRELGGFMAYELAVQQPKWVRQWGGIPPNNARGAGHPLGAVVLAYRVTGEEVFWKAARDWVDRAFGWIDRADGTWKHNENVPFMEGYLARSLINFIENCSPEDEIQRQKAISLVSALVDAGLKWSWVPGRGFGYQHWDTAGAARPADASVASVTMGDPAAWLALHTGSVRYRDSVKVFMNTFPDYLRGWKGGFTGRVATYMERRWPAVQAPPEPITDLVVGSDAKLTFTSRGGRAFVVRWYTKPIRDTHFETFDSDTTARISWWAAHASPALEAPPPAAPVLAVPLPAGRKQTLWLYDVPAGTSVHVMVKTVGEDGAWSRGSAPASAAIARTVRSGLTAASLPKPRVRK